jgi:mono/diheme cytochrome c family protein
MSDQVGQVDKPIFTRDVFGQFQTYCGGCHVDAALGGFEDQKVNFDNFPELVTREALELMQSDDLDIVMPKPVAGGKAWSERPEGDPIRSFAALLEEWLDAGSPPDVFFRVPETDDEAELSPYLMSPEEGEGLTNLGSCLPEPQTFATDEAEMKRLDSKFAAMTELPTSLRETDFHTLSGQILAEQGVFAVAPTYPLWSDGSGKLRLVRLPYGSKFKFDGGTNEFDIPENTRVYKTFFKEVKELDGRVAHRKIETRLIVARHEDCDGVDCVRSLFGVYAWNDDETEATLVRDPLRNGEEWRDRIVTYVTDEAKAQEAGTDASLLAEATRHYAMPGKERCVQCHMGSPTKTFLLGLSPVQLNRVPYVREADDFDSGDELLGDGVLEEDQPTPDEANQFDRLLEIGVIDGIESAALVPRLKDLAAEPPRNNFELRAQGYMLGNCSSCHHPRGFPSIKLPELKGVLNFYPDKSGGGVFQFPLERYSPRVKRGEKSDIEVPYITPSLYDRPGGSNAVQTDPLALSYRSKCIPRISVDGEDPPADCVKAPWRSLIYRNVDTPFTTADDFAIFPHMPRHVAGFDCRAPRIMAEWMVTIPSMTKTPTQDTTLYPEKNIEEFQPRAEVILDPARSFPFIVAVGSAKQRLQEYRESERYSYCPNTSDILDPEVLAGEVASPSDKGQRLPGQPAVLWYDSVPDRAHFALVDNTDVGGSWVPRRPDWQDVLLGDDPGQVASLPESEKRVLSLLAAEDLEITEEFRNYVLTPEPIGAWKNSAACESSLSQYPLVSDLEPRPYWAKDYLNEKVYEMSPGAAVFTIICRNCHGPNANADSALADTIQDISGGAARVANLRDGLFGPVSSPGAAALGVFGDRALEMGLSTQELSSRYLLWMALGGTEVNIPVPALKIVQNTGFLGQRRRGANLPSANMLSNAEDICRMTLPAGQLFQVSAEESLASRYQSTASGVEFDVFSGMDMTSWTPVSDSAVITKNGDAELWTKLCVSRQRAPVKGLVYTSAVNDFDHPNYTPIGLDKKLVVAQGGKDFPAMYRLYDPVAYGTNPVMTPSGVQLGVPLGEPEVWCLERAKTPEGRVRQDEWAATNLVNGEPYPLCPENVALWGVEEQRDFVTRGAMAAGLAVYTYLDALARGQVEPPVAYDQCQKLDAP